MCSSDLYVERAAALEALTAAGRFDAAYFAELARIARFADADGVADVVLAGSAGGQGQAPAMKTLATLLGDGVATRLYQGKEVYAGLPGVRTARSGLVFPSETRTIARISRALATSAPSHPKLPLLRDALVTLGKGDGWGSKIGRAHV